MSVRVVDLEHIYNKGLPDETIAISRINFEAQDGEIVGVIGKTGSGKSTLMQHLNGLLRPTAGSIFINDLDISREGISLTDVRKEVGLVFQYPEYQLFEESVEKDIAFGPGNLGFNEEKINACVREALELVEMDYDKFKEKSPFDLSGGEKRRVAIAGVLAMRPKILILDEPTAGLDPDAHKSIVAMIKNIHKNISNIIFIVSHNMDDIEELSDRVLVINNGEIVKNGSPAEVFSEAEELFDYGLGLPTMKRFIYKLKNNGVDVGKVKTFDELSEKIYQVCFCEGKF